MVTATKTEINNYYRIPLRVEGMTMTVIGTFQAIELVLMGNYMHDFNLWLHDRHGEAQFLK